MVRTCMSHLFDWITLPPFLSILLLGGALMVGGEGTSASIPLPLWIAAGGAYIVSSAIYVPLGKLKGTGASLGLQALCQGLALALTSLHFGLPPVVAWGGTALIFSGAIILGGIAVPEAEAAKPAQRRSAPSNEPPTTELSGADGMEQRPTSSLASCPLPFAVIGRNGMFQDASKGLLDLVGTSLEDLREQEGEMLFPSSLEHMTVKGKHYAVLRKELDGEAWVFLLPQDTSAQKQDDATTNRTSSGSSAESGFSRDPGTGLYGDTYFFPRASYEIARARRFRRWLSALLVELDFLKRNEADPQATSEANRRELLLALCRRFNEEIRDTDLAFLLQDNSLCILLPETPQSGAKTVMGRMKEALFHMTKDNDRLTSLEPHLRFGLHFYSGNEDMSLPELLDALRMSKQQTSAA